jgi:4-hydroxythreonine-4-phosphate dehydrogenase
MKPIAITMGDAAGIGPEILAKAFLQDPQLCRSCFVAGDLQVMRRACRIVAGEGVAPSVVSLESINDSLQVPAGSVPVLQIGAPMQLPVFGQVSSLAGTYAGQCVQWAVLAALRGDLAALVTGPLHKEALALADAPYCNFPGHTEMLQSFCAERTGCSVDSMPVRMMLANQELRTVLVSIHVSLRDAIEAVTFDNVLQTLKIAHAALLPVLGRVPRVAVAGLNPHAGEGGRFGREEIEIIRPAVEAARSLGIDASGPFPPDTVFMRARRQVGGDFGSDVVIAMYHDQGLIPVKYLGVEHGVNVTLGLPMIRTSPDHGTAFDIAGTGQASADSLRAAIAMAQQMATF